jgi:hypothetical protein
VERGEFGQTVDCSDHVVIDHDRLSKLFPSMHHSMANRVNAEISSIKPARFLQHLQHAPDRLNMGRDRACRLDHRFSSWTEHHFRRGPDVFYGSFIPTARSEAGGCLRRFVEFDDLELQGRTSTIDR